MITLNRSDDPIVSLIVVGWRDAPHLTTCLGSVATGLRDIAYEVLVVLNEPTASLRDQVARDVTGARVWVFRSNLGFGGAVNYAAAHASGEFLLLINDDSIIESGYLAPLIDIMRRRQRCAIAGTTYLHPDGSLQEAGSVIWQDGTTSAVGDGRSVGYMYFERKVDYCSGGSVLIRKSVWDELGGFDERYYPAYYEDVDLCLRAAAHGWEVWYEPLASLRHIRSASSGASFRALLGARGLHTFRERWADVLAEQCAPGQVESAVWQAMGHPIRVLVIDDLVPQAVLGSGYGRMLDALASLAADDSLHVAFHPRMGDATPSDVLATLGIRGIADLESHLATPDVSYEVVVVSRPHNAEIFRPLLAERLPDAEIIYDAEALFHRRILMQTNRCNDASEREALQAEASRMRELEVELAQWADRTVCISEVEAAILRAKTSKPVEVVEPWLSAPTPTTADFTMREHIGFVAGWSAGPGSPNADGLVWFAKYVLPKVRAAVPTCRLLVTGQNPPDDVSWMAGTAVEFVGSVPNLWGFYNGLRAVVSPTRIGAGVKLKTVESIQYGVPVVSTSEGASGLPVRLRAAVWEADDPDDFARVLISLVTDLVAWERTRKALLDACEPTALERRGVGRWPEIIHETVRSRSKGGQHRG